MLSAVQDWYVATFCREHEHDLDAGLTKCMAQTLTEIHQIGRDGGSA
jgi:hypothetical protein